MGHVVRQYKNDLKRGSPVTMALLRFLLATGILLVMHKKWEPPAKMEKAPAARLALSGFLGITLYFILENSGVKLTTASNTALITSVIPLIATALDMLWYKSKLSLLHGAGMLLALAGTYLTLTENGRLHFDSVHIQGNLLILGATATWALYTLFNKSFRTNYSSLTVTTYQHICGTVLLLPLALAEYKEWKMISIQAMANIVYLAVFCSVGRYLLYSYALRKLDVAAATMYLNLVPVIGTVSGTIWLKETLSPIQLAGGGIVMAAIVLVHMKKRKQAWAEV
ncbi:DMT family transporter [Paenibacillus sp. P25]|nr:DMT family transporter [Paenibacillus sp. P25]